MFPPHTRGWTLWPELTGDKRLVSPAHAGMDPPSAISGVRSTSFPRTRGDGPLVAVAVDSNPTFPPHTRGWTLFMILLLFHLSVSPAHAGMDLVYKTFTRIMLRFPRTRGDGPLRKCLAAATKRFPPHTRGWTAASKVGIQRAAVSPAHAGMDRTHCSRTGR